MVKKVILVKKADSQEVIHVCDEDRVILGVFVKAVTDDNRPITGFRVSENARIGWSYYHRFVGKVVTAHDIEEVMQAVDARRRENPITAEWFS